jgi:hypothetical protein
MRRTLLLVTAAALCAAPGYASFSKDDAGTAAAQFLKLGVGARPAALGEAYAAVADGAAATYWNPAGLAQVTRRDASFMHAVWFESIAYDWFAYAQPVRDWGVFGIGIQYLNYGSIDGTDASGNETGSFSPSDTGVTVSWGRTLSGVALGASVKYLSSRITETATTVAADFGGMCRLMDGRLSLGAAVQNIGAGLKYVDDESPLPLNIKIGGAYALRENWLAVLDVNAAADNEPVYGAGTEYRYPIGERMQAAGRLGFSTRARDTGGLNGVSAGLGFTYRDYTIDYAFVPYGDLGDTHRISLGVKF